MSLVDLLRRRACEEPERRAYTFLASGEADTSSLSHEELDRQARAVGALVQESGGGGERALLLYPPGLGFVASFFGALYGGAVAVPAYPPRVGRGQPRLRAIARDAAPRLVLTTTALATRAEALVEEIPELRSAVWLATDALPAGLETAWRDPGAGPETLAFLQYTSGSTADPKGVMVSHGNLLHNQEMIRRAFSQSRDSVIVGWLPLYHDMGLIGNVMQPLYVGGRCILISPMAFLQRPLRWLEAVSRYRATTSGGPNFAYELCARKIGAREAADLDLSSWTVAYNGAEPVRAETLERFAAAFAPYGFDRRAFYPCYGLAEATLFVSGGEPGRPAVVETVEAPALEKGEAVPAAGTGGPRRELVGCGQAWMGQEIRIADPETGAMREPGQVGEIWVAGPSVAQGYWNRPAETASTFVAWPDGDGRFLRTGDLGFLRGSELFVTGRLKDLIILRGRNLYPQDVELSAERSHPALRSGCGAAFSVELGGEERLVVVLEVERGREDAVAEIAGAVRQAVAEEHDAQVHEIVLLPPGKILKTSSGKIQRRACRAQYLAGELPAAGRSALGAEETSEISETAEISTGEAWLRERLARLFGLPASAVAPDQPLTSLGIDSLSAVELQHALEAELGVGLAVTELLEGPTVRELAERLARGAGGESRAVPPRASRSRREGEEVPLSYGQRALWFLQRLQPEGSAYNIAAAVRVRSELDLDALRRAWEILAERHEALRANFPESEDGPLQRILPGGGPHVFVEAAEEWSEERLHGRLLEEAGRPFDLQLDSLLRLGVFPLAGGDHAVILVVHHIVADLWSLALLVRELGTVYSALRQGREPRLEPLPVSYPEAVEQQLGRLEGEAGERLWAYWSERLEGELPVADLPTDRQRPLVQSFRGGARSLRIDDLALLGRLRDLGRNHRTTLFATLLAAFQALLHRYSGQTDLIVGSPTAGRETPGLAGVVGYFVNPLPLRTDLSGDPPFSGLLGRVRETVLGAFRHQDLPFPLMVERLQPRRDSGRSPIFQSMFVLQRVHLPELRDVAAFALGQVGVKVSLGGLELESMTLESRASQFDLELMAAETERGLALTLIYDADLFDATTAQRVLRHLETLARSAAERPDLRIGELPLLTAGEQTQLLLHWNDTAMELPAGGFPELFEEQAARTPEAVAAEEGDLLLTFAELNARANRLARTLLARIAGVGGPENRVAVWADRSLDFLTAVVGILKSGCAYLPLDPRQPAPRLVQMLERSGCRLVLASEARLDACRRALEGRPDLSVLPLRGSLENGSGEDLRISLSPDRLAYVLFTSGSTGLPKGAMIEHRGMLNHLLAKVWDLGLRPEDRVAQTAAPTFDISVWQFLAALLAGGRVRIVPDEVVAEPTRLLREVEERRVTVLEVVPSLMRALLDEVASADPGSRPGLSSLRWLIPTGEALPPDLCQSWFASYPGIPLVNAYGPTECSDDVTHHLLAGPLPEGAPRTPVGRPIANLRLYAVDRGLSLLPVGVPGELCVAGIGVGRGYVGDPGRTAEVFVPDPFSARPGARLYRTGDLGFWRPDGVLEVLGRSDDQVKIRGFRVEPGEVEAALALHPDVREAVVLARRDRRGEARLAAYWTARPDATASPADLREYLRQHLPEAMVPAAFVLLEALPLTPNGKVDRRALPAPDWGKEGAAAALAPRDEIEALVAGAFAEVLGIERIGMDESFFEAGGHSLLATQAVSRLRRTLGIDLPLRSLFEEPTVSGMAARVRVLRGDGPGAVPSPPRRWSRGSAAPLAFAQQRLWFLSQLEPESPEYNMPGEVRLAGPLSVPALRASLEEVVRRHESLRTVFPSAEGEPWQEVLPALEVRLPVADLSALPAPDRERCARELAWGESRRPFDLAHGPLLRAVLVRLGEEEHRLLFTLHHIVSDGWSQGVLVREISASYRAFSAGEAPSLPELPVQYADFALWQRDWLQGDVLAAQLAYWQGALGGGNPVLELPLEHPRPARRTHRGRRQEVHVEPAAAEALRAFCRREGTTLFMGLMAAFQALLHRYSGQSDIRVGTPIANRRWEELEGLIGFFVNTLVLRADFSGEPSGAPSLRGLLHQVRESALGAYAHQDVPFERLVDELQPERDLSRTPLFQAMFILQNAPMRPLALSGLELSLAELHNGTAKYELTLSLEETAEGLRGWLEYNSDLFDGATAGRLLAGLDQLLRAGAGQPAVPIAALSLLSEADRHQIVHEWNDFAAAVPSDTCVHLLFEAQVERRPDESAVSGEGVDLTYRELNERANRLARRLRSLGVRWDVPVGVCADRSADVAVALLAVLKAGGSYIPLDPAYPRERLAMMLDDAGVPLVLARSAMAGFLPEQGARLLLLDGEDLAREESGNLGLTALPDNLAYVLFTSGSTGRPKGVQISHRALVNLLVSMGRLLPAFAGEPLISVTTLSFDIACMEIFLPLISGGRVLLASREITTDGTLLAAEIERTATRAMLATPATWRLLLDAGWQGVPGLTALCGGEAMPRDFAHLLRPRVGQLWNGYGPTEATIWSTAGLVGEEGGSIPIGRPIANTLARVLDRGWEPVPLGVAGELAMGGAGLARGYVARPELTAERFIPDPAGEQPGARLYRTGDLVRWLPDGRLEYLGRIDQQVKVRGFRIELEEIETVLASHPAVAQAVVAARGEGTDRILVAYVVPAGPAPLAPGDLRRFVAQRLPEYMVPSRVAVLDALPLTPSGKVDRRALPAPEPLSAAPGELQALGSPEEEVLAGIWARVLGRERVGVDESFFELGGHSLLATQAVSRIREAFRVDLPLRALFEAPTVAGMARKLSAVRRERRPAPPLVPRPHSGPLAASYAQERLWVMDQLIPNDPVFNVFQVLRLTGPLDEAVLERSFAEVVRRHETLRTTFTTTQGLPVQVVETPGSFVLHRMDLSAAPDPEAEARRLAREEARRPFALRSGPLFRAKLLTLAPESRVLLLAMHHIVCDDWSIGILVREVAALHRAFQDGLPSPLPELTVQYADFAAWQREWLSGGILDEELGYWKARLAGLPVLELPTDRPRPPVQSHHGAVLPFELPADLSAALRRAGLAEEATLFMTILAGFAAALHRITAQDDLIVGSPVAGRTRTETEPLIGFFVNILPLRIDLSGSPTWRELLRRVRAAALEAYDHQDVPFEKLVEALQPRRDLSHPPVRQVVFALQDAAMQPVELPGVAVQPIDVDPGVARLDLTLFLWETGGGLRGVCEFDTDLFAPSTVARWLAFLRQALEDMAAGLDRPLPALAEPARETAGALSRREPNLTEGQLLFWFAPKLQPNVQLYFDRATTTFTLSGALDRACFEAAFQKLVEACDVLRTQVREVDGLPWRTTAAFRPVPLEYFDFSGAPDPEAAFQAWLAGRCRKEMRPEERLFDTALARVGPERFVWFFNAHHMIVDAGSLLFFARQLSHLYELARQGWLHEAPALRSYEEYVEAERENRASERYQRARVYWERKLAEPVAANAFYRRPGTAPTTRTARLSVELPDETSAAVRSLAAGLGLFSPAVVFTSLLFAYQQRLSGERRLRVGTSFANRPERFRDVAGLMMNTCPLQIEVDAGETLRSLAGKVQREMVETARHQHHPVRNPVDAPAYDVYINFQLAAFRELCGLPVAFDLVHSGHSNDLLGLQVSDFRITGRFRVDFDFNEAAFSGEERERSVRHYLGLLAALLEDGEARLSEVPLLAAEERRQLLSGWNDTAAGLPDVPFIRLFEAQVARTPEAVAASCRGERLTYRELDRRAQRLARVLAREGMGPESVIPLLADRGLDFLTALLAIFKVGGVYLPLDPHHPPQRLAQVLERSGAVLALHGAAGCGPLTEAAALLPSGSRFRTVALEPLLTAATEEGGALPGPEVGGLAYVIFTSGSTGVPKGAMVEPRGMLNHLLAKVEDLGLTERDVVVQNASQSFDISVWQFLVVLLTGGRVHIVPDEIAYDPARLLAEVVRERVTVLEVVPSLLAVLLDHPLYRTASPPALPDLRWMILTGEVLPLELCRRWLGFYPGIPMLNAYGPTECSDDVTHHLILQPPADDRPVPIGRPLRNLRLYVLDRQLLPLPAGIPGELCVGGVGVGRGYLREPARTAEVFVPDGLSGETGARLYRTGDLARWLPDGTVEFLGRLDYQVKIRGFRIELGEIESLLARFPGVREVVVVAREDRPGNKRLVAYFVPEQGWGPSPQQLRGYLQGKLPDYMVPAALVPLDAMPLTPNGKVDRHALPVPGDTSGEAPRRAVAPSTPLELLIASIWAEVLGTEVADVEASFFDLGGNSLLATQVIAMLQDVLPIELPLRKVFEAPTVAGLAGIINSGRSSLGEQEQRVLAEILVDFEQGMNTQTF